MAEHLLSGHAAAAAGSARGRAGDCVLDDLVELGAVICGAARAAAWLVDGERMRCVARVGEPRDEASRFDEIVERAIRSGELVEAREDGAEVGAPDDADLERRATFFAAAPLRAPDGSVVGVLAVEDDAPRRLSEDARRGLRAVAEKLARRMQDHFPVEPPRAEDTLLRSEAGFRLLVESVRDYAIFMLDPVGRVATWNPGAARFKGYDEQEIVGRHFSVFYPPDAVATGHPDHELRIAAREGRYHEEGWRVRKDGSRFWADVTITALRDPRGALVGFAKVTRDLTERMLAERRLAQQRATLFSVFMGAPACICVLRGPDHVFELANEPYRRLMGGRELVGLPVRHAVPELGSAYLDLLDRVYETGEPYFGSEMPARIERGDGAVDEKFFDFVYQPMRDGQGRPEGIIAFGFEVTEQVRARRALQDLADERARLIDELRGAVRVRDEFLAIASHELKTPLTPLQLQLENVRRSLARAGVCDADTSRRLEQARRQTERLVHLVDDLLDVSRISAGRLALQRETFDLSEAAREVVERYREAARPGGSLVRLSAEAPVQGTWDRIRVEQVLSNLLSNAIKYGGGKPIDVRVEAQGAAATLTVRDRGMGIAGADVERIFGRFERAVSTRHFGGLGLGLYIVRQIVEAHGGSIEVRSTPSDGTTFVVSLPR